MVTSLAIIMPRVYDLPAYVILWYGLPAPERMEKQSGVCILKFAIKRETIRRQQEKSNVERVLFL
jgi:hypothetical protein